LTYEAGGEPDPLPITVRSSPRPTIGVTMPDRGDTLPWLALKFAVWLAGGRAVRLTARAPRDPRTIDGLIFGGGSDVYPLAYEGQPKPGYRYDLARGDMEASWAVAARRHDLPVLGVCRGAQMLNVLAGGTLHPDLSGFEGRKPTASLWERLTVREVVEVRENSRFFGSVQARRLLVNVGHQQAIDRLGVGLTVVARHDNGLIQVVEDRARRFWIGVQHHPEMMIHRTAPRRLFKGLVEAARARRVERAVA
jgi:gamma-glutamyl-gamma-aminobutyrate hydrolase PuuD